MNAQQLRNLIPNLCGMPSKAAWIETPTACYLVGEVKPYALQVCNAGAMPESFEDWLKQGNDAIDDPGGNIIPDRVKANQDQYKIPF